MHDEVLKRQLLKIVVKQAMEIPELVNVLNEQATEAQVRKVAQKMIEHQELTLDHGMRLVVSGCPKCGHGWDCHVDQGVCTERVDTNEFCCCEELPPNSDRPETQRSIEQRPTWPETWMGVAKMIASRSYDPRLKVGAIIVSSDNTQVLSVGYNGNYRGGPHEHESTEPGLSGFIHAEINALLKVDYNFPKEKHMYVTHSPCRMCAKCLINGGVKQLVYNEMYRDESGLDLLRSAGVRVLSLDQAILIATRSR